MGQRFDDWRRAHNYRTEVRAFMQSNFFHDSVELSVLRFQDSDWPMAGKIVYEKVEENTYVEPTLRMDRQTAQFLMDDLYRLGIRPSDEVDSAGELKATKGHLDDMRSMVSSLLHISLKGVTGGERP